MTDAIILEQQVTSSSDEVEERTSRRVKFNSADPAHTLSSNVILGAAVCVSFVLLHQIGATFGEILSSGVV